MVIGVCDQQFEIRQRVGPENQCPGRRLGPLAVHAPQPHSPQVGRRLHQDGLEPDLGKCDGFQQPLLGVSAAGLAVDVVVACSVLVVAMSRVKALHFGHAADERVPVRVVDRRSIFKDSPAPKK